MSTCICVYVSVHIYILCISYVTSMFTCMHACTSGNVHVVQFNALQHNVLECSLHICTQDYVCNYDYACIHACMHVRFEVRVCMCAYMRRYACVYVCMCLRMNVPQHACMCVCMWRHTFSMEIPTYKHTYIHTYIYIYLLTYLHTSRTCTLYLHTFKRFLVTCIHARTHTCKHRYMHLLVHDHTHTCIHSWGLLEGSHYTHTFIHIHTYVHTHTQTYTCRDAYIQNAHIICMRMFMQMQLQGMVPTPSYLHHDPAWWSVFHLSGS